MWRGYSVPNPAKIEANTSHLRERASYLHLAKPTKNLTHLFSSATESQDYTKASLHIAMR
jgi:hypothetical protein